VLVWALGVRATEVPASPNRLWELIRAAKSRSSSE